MNFYLILHGFGDKNNVFAQDIFKSLQIQLELLNRWQGWRLQIVQHFHHLRHSGIRLSNACSLDFLRNQNDVSKSK